MPSRSPVGVFDSGVGGLSILREIARQLPGEDLLYFADSAHCPYGPRPSPDIRRLSHAVAAFLVEQGAKLIVVACNTASAAALESLRATFPVPFVGMVPAVKTAVGLTRSGRVGVLATAGTVQGNLYSDVVERFADGVELHTRVGHGLVELVEAGEIDGPRAEGAVAHYVGPLLDAGVDTLVLGCTHYPFLVPLIERVSHGRLTIVEPSAAIAAQTRRVLTQHDLLNAQPQGNLASFTSGDPAAFAHSLTQLIRASGPVTHVVWAGDRWQVDPVATEA